MFVRYFPQRERNSDLLICHFVTIEMRQGGGERVGEKRQGCVFPNISVRLPAKGAVD